VAEGPVADRLIDLKARVNRREGEIRQALGARQIGPVSALKLCAIVQEPP
jgi:hypothetical protein